MIKTGVSKNNNPKTDSIWVADLLGDVSGAIKATPSLEAARWAPDLTIKFSSVHVRPESQ